MKGNLKSCIAVGEFGIELVTMQSIVNHEILEWEISSDIKCHQISFQIDCTKIFYLTLLNIQVVYLV